MKTSLVPTALLPTCLEEILPHLERAADTTSGRYEVEDIIGEIYQGQQQLWVPIAEDGSIPGIVTTRVVQYPRRTMMLGVFCAGDRLSEWMNPMLEMLHKFAKDNGCDGFEMSGRKGWERVLKPDGWKPAFTVYEKDYR